MSLLDTFDPHSEEIIKVNLQRSFHEADHFPEFVVAFYADDCLDGDKWYCNKMGAMPSCGHEKICVWLWRSQRD